MSFTSKVFFLLAIGTVVALRLFRQTQVRQIVFLLASFALIYQLAAHQIWDMLPFALFLAGGYVITRLLIRYPSVPLLAVALSCLVLSFFWLKGYFFLSFLPAHKAAFSLGLAYIFCRTVHLFVEAQQGNLERKHFSILDYCNYQVSFLTLACGPIDTFKHFQEDFNHAFQHVKGSTSADLFRYLERLIWGYAKLLIFCPWLFSLHEELKNEILSHSPSYGAFYFFGTSALYTVYLYLNFSGYMDIVIALGSLMGFSLPENFNKPWESKNFLELWTRWHITLSSWCRNYIFNPLAIGLVSRLDSAGAQIGAGLVAYFLAFFVMGLWHGATSTFLFYGMYLGGVACLSKLRQIWFPKLNEHIGRALTFAFFSLGLTCFWTDVPFLVTTLTHLKSNGFLAGFGAMVLSFGFLSYVLSFFKRPQRSKFPDGVSPTNFLRLGFLIALVFLHYVVQDSAVAEFVYQRF